MDDNHTPRLGILATTGYVSFTRVIYAVPARNLGVVRNVLLGPPFALISARLQFQSTLKRVIRVEPQRLPRRYVSDIRFIGSSATDPRFIVGVRPISISFCQFFVSSPLAISVLPLDSLKLQRARVKFTLRNYSPRIM